MPEKTCNCFDCGGDTVLGWWICAGCYKKHADRPSKLVRRYVFDAERDETIPRQDVIYSTIAEVGGVTLSQFIAKMSRYLVAFTRGTWGREEATEYAIGLLEMAGDRFGDPEFSWDESAAVDIVNEDLQYWDFESDGNS